MSDRLAGSLNSPQILRHTLNDCLWPMTALRDGQKSARSGLPALLINLRIIWPAS